MRAPCECLICRAVRGEFDSRSQQRVVRSRRITPALVLGTPVGVGSGRSEKNRTINQNSSCASVASRYIDCMTTKYFSGAIELKGSYPLRRNVVRLKFPEGTIKKYDDFSLMVGTIDGRISNEDFLPVTRIIRHNEHGTLHKCGSKCRSAKGGNCECSCGGEFHGCGA